MRLIAWTEYRAYDLAYDAIMARITGFDEHCQAHWQTIDGASKGYRERREETLIRIQKHIEAGEPAGEIEDAAKTR